MTREEIANELFATGKEIKQCFLNEMSSPENTNTNSSSVYFQYIQLLNNLNILYNALNTNYKDYNKQVTELTDWNFTQQNSVQTFMSKFLSILNGMLLNTIKFRKKYCLIRRNDMIPGFASHIITNLGQIVKCLNDGYIPVIDTMNAKNIFTDLSKSHSTNAWELYFRQPFSLKYEDIIFTKDTKILEGIPAFMPNYNMDCLSNYELMTFWNSVMKKYMPFSNEFDTYLNQCLENLPFETDAKILGVLCRGTDYTNIRPYNHPVQTPLNAIFTKTDEFMDKYQCDYCYLATEDQEVLHAFQDKFKDRLLTTQKIYYNTHLTDTINQTNMDSRIDIYHKNMEYLAALALLSKCQYFVGGRTSGTVVVFLLSNKFKGNYIFDCGRYGIDDASSLTSYIL